MALSDWQDNQPTSDEYGDSYKGYVSLVNSKNVITALLQQGQKLTALIHTLSSKQADYRYAEGKWSVRQVLGHLIDTERVMAYRALCISRGDKTPLPGFDQDKYMDHAHFEERDLQSLAAEYDALRNADISMFSSFNQEQAQRSGTASGYPVSVRALAYIIAGHEKHHLNILKERYNIKS
ncbi:MAG TPA: DinB family protein [Balneolaceae bacterium]|nr:DinB family protein [Balneolaceae bacterium]